MQYNIHNEKTKKDYEAFLQLNEQLSAASVRGKLADIRKYEEHTGFADFKTFNRERALGFKAAYRGQKLDLATISRTLRNVQAFFRWLGQQPKYRRHICLNDLVAFNLSSKEEAVARRKLYRHPPTLEQLRHTLATMPADTEQHRRDRAMLACLVLSSARVAALVSLKLKHVDMADRCIMQDASEVNTKFGKSFPTFFFPVGEVFEQELAGWVAYLREGKLCGLDAPLFPAMQLEYDAATDAFKREQLSARHITSTTTVRTIMRQAFEKAGLPYFNPHSIRNTLVQLGQKCCQTPEDFKAFSQNLGHSSPLTTFTSYGEVYATRQGEILAEMATKTETPPDQTR